MFSIPCPVREVLITSAIRKEGQSWAQSCRFWLLKFAQVEFCVNGKKQDYSMKLGEGGEAFFVFETSADIPENLQTSPLVSPMASPKSLPAEVRPLPDLQEPDFLDLATGNAAKENGVVNIPAQMQRAQSDIGQPPV
jgi:phosphatidate phosphatase LPIN